MERIRSRSFFGLALFLFLHTLWASQPLDGPTRQAVIESISQALIEGYIYEEKGRQLAAQLQERLRSGSYDALSEGPAFAEQLTRDLRAWSQDGHLRIFHASSPGPSAEERRRHAAPRRGISEENQGFVKVEILPGDVGYVDLRAFMSSPQALAKCDEVMARLAEVDALILDLGQNSGGGEPLVRHLSAYLFAEPVHLANTWMRGMEEPRQRWTMESVPGKRLSDIPVYILTSRRTFSAAESFTFGLKINGRVTLVGERTGGGGHFGGIQPLIGDFRIWLPRGRTYDPRTGKGWEAEGIAPDIEVPYEEALETALQHARNL